MLDQTAHTLLNVQKQIPMSAGHSVAFVLEYLIACKRASSCHMHEAVQILRCISPQLMEA